MRTKIASSELCHDANSLQKFYTVTSCDKKLKTLFGRKKIGVGMTGAVARLNERARCSLNITEQ